MTEVITPLQNLVEGTASTQAGKSFSGQRLIKLNVARGVFSKIRVGICVDVKFTHTAALWMLTMLLAISIALCHCYHKIQGSDIQEGFLAGSMSIITYGVVYTNKAQCTL